MRKWLSLITFFSISSGISAQFYPDSTGTWCIRDLNNSTALDITMEMRVGYDTIINGNTYQLIDEFHGDDNWSVPEYIKTYYVRSDTAGNGFIYIPALSEEYLTGNINVNVGDTIENLYMGFAGSIAIVDSAVILSNASDTVRRVYVRQPWIGNSFSSIKSFWQSGMGCSFGPYINYDDFQDLTCVIADGRYTFSLSIPGNHADQLPIVPCECVAIATNVEEGISRVLPSIFPNPSTSTFTIRNASCSNEIAVYTTTGHRVWQGTGNTIDLIAQPPGVYTAVVATERGRQAVRLVVVR
jgi:hypothetical protein